MSHKPDFLHSMQLPPQRIHKRERYLPTAFDESLSILERINKMVMYLNEYSDLTEQMLVKWNEVYHWVMNDGLDQMVGDRLREWLDNGTLYRIINEELLGDINSKVDEMREDFDGLKEEIQDKLESLNDEFDNLKTQLNDDIEELKSQILADFDTLENNLVNMINNLINSKSEVVVSSNEPENPSNTTQWFEIFTT